MIWGRHFVWIHIGRTGGYSVDAMCRILEAPDIHLDPNGGEWSRWKRHQTIAQRSAEEGTDVAAGRATVANFRRLPHWILSFAEYKKKNEGLDFTVEELAQGRLRAETREMETGTLDPSRAREVRPDALLEYYGLAEMDHLLRTETLPDDFIALMERWYPISEEQRARIRGVVENDNQYNRDLWSRFSREQVRSMYESSPQWARLEQKLYGGLLA
jgi:hypothetical protein